MLSNLESPKSQPDSYGQLVFVFIRETDRFIDAVGQRAATIRSRTNENADEIVHRISDSRIASKQLSASLANLNRALNDSAFQNAILGIQRALNEIIWKFSGIRKYCLGLKMKGAPLPPKSPLNHMVNQLDGEVYRAIRKITDSLELASERYYGLERVQDEHINLYDVEKELELFEYFEPAHEATFIILESQKYQIREILNLYGIEPKPVVKRPRQGNTFGKGEHEFLDQTQGFSGNSIHPSEERLSKIEQDLSKSVVELQARMDELSASVHSVRQNSASEIGQIVDGKIERIEEEFSRTVSAMQSRNDELNMTVRALKHQQASAVPSEQIEQQLATLSQADAKRQREMSMMYNQLKQLMEINERLQFRLEQAEERIEDDLKPVKDEINKQKKDQDVVAAQIDKILVIMNEKYAFLESKIPANSAVQAIQQMKPELEKIYRKLDENNSRMNELASKVNQVESRQESLIKNLNDRFNNVILMLREDMHVISKKRVDAMIRKFIDYMKGTNGEHKVH